MNNMFLLILAVLLLVSAPFVLLGAEREGERRHRRATRDRQDAGGRAP